MLDVQEKIKKIICIYKELSEQTNLYPSRKIDGLFDELVSICVMTNEEDSERILQDGEIQKISSHVRKLCSLGESCMEEAVASRILESQNPQQELKQFKYYKNYAELSEKESSVIKSNPLNNNSEKILFIGSGPLPLSAIFLAQKGYVVDCIDKDQTSVDTSRLLIQKLCLQNSINIYQEDFYVRTYCKGYKAIVLASLVGENQEDKKRIVGVLAKKVEPDTLLLIRSVDNLGELLYQQVRLDILDDFQIIQNIEATPSMVNSVIMVSIKNDNVKQAQKNVYVLLEKFNFYRNKQILLSVAEKIKNNDHIFSLKKEMATISDSMKFDTPLIWLMYKHQAYKNTEKAIITVGDLRKHVDYPGDICYKRFDFLYKYLLNKRLNIQDKNIFLDEMSLVSFYNLCEILKFSDDEQSIQDWQQYEYYMNNEQVAKWQNYTKV